MKTTIIRLAPCALLLAIALPASADQQILDDLIVDGSACIGFDCVNGESFGFDTLRLKENNLRIKFQDTSTSASFPSNDWQLTANDTSNGGANKFSIDDISGGRTPFTVEASAPSHSLYVDDGGRIGLGTSTPVVEVHVKDGDTPTLRLEQDGSSGFTPQTWDLAGNETNFFIRDATNGSKLPFRIRPDAPSNSIYVDTDGDIGMGTSSPNAGNGAGLIVEVKDSASAAVVVDGGGGAADYAEFLMEADDVAQWSFGHAAGNNRFYVFDYKNGDGNFGEMLTILTDTGKVGLKNNSPTFDLHIGSTTFSGVNAGDLQFTNTSSRSLKENFNEIQSNGIAGKIAEIPVYTYDYIAGPKDKLGLIAEDFHSVFERGEDTTISGQEVQMALWLAVQEQQVAITRLEEEIRALQQPQ